MQQLDRKNRLLVHPSLPTITLIGRFVYLAAVQYILYNKLWLVESTACQLHPIQLSGTMTTHGSNRISMQYRQRIKEKMGFQKVAFCSLNTCEASSKLLLT